MLTHHKKRCLFFLGLICTVRVSDAMEQKQENPFFNLEDVALNAVVVFIGFEKKDNKVRKLKELAKNKLLKVLTQARDKDDYNFLPLPFRNVVLSNLVWVTLRSHGLEKKKIELLTNEQKIGFDKVLLNKLQNDLCEELEQKEKDFDKKNGQIRDMKSIHTAIDALEKTVKTVVGTVLFNNVPNVIFEQGGDNEQEKIISNLQK